MSLLALGDVDGSHPPYIPIPVACNHHRAVAVTPRGDVGALTIPECSPLAGGAWCGVGVVRAGVSAGWGLPSSLSLVAVV